MIGHTKGVYVTRSCRQETIPGIGLRAAEDDREIGIRGWVSNWHVSKGGGLKSTTPNPIPENRQKIGEKHVLGAVMIVERLPGDVGSS
jgi:hypothetical protein